MSAAPVIEKGVPLPVDRAGGWKRQYPFHVMEVGDSFTQPKEQMKRLCAAAHSQKKRTGMSFTVRTVGDVVRVWRLS